MSLPVPTAKDINDAHEMAKDHADAAVEWAIKCGVLLKAKADTVEHGDWAAWVEKNCTFSYRTARKYIQVAGQDAKRIQNGPAVPFSSIAEALEYDKPEKPKDSPKGAVPVVKAAPAATGETVIERPAAPAPIPDPAPPARDEHDEDAAIEAAEAELAASTDKWLQADDKLAAAHAEIKRLTAELAVVKLSRDAAVNARQEALRLLQAEQRKVARLEKQVKKAA